MWFVNVTKVLTFTVGALPAGASVFLDYRRQGEDDILSLVATIDSLTTGACRASFTPTLSGVWFFWPRVLESGGALRDIGYAKAVRVYDVPETYREES